MEKAGLVSAFFFAFLLLAFWSPVLAGPGFRDHIVDPQQPRKIG
jgi:hypothetical protein